MKFENTKVYNFEGAFRGLRNPKESWHLSDSYFGPSDEYQNQEAPDIKIAKKWLEYYQNISTEEYKKLYGEGKYLKQLSIYDNALCKQGFLDSNYNSIVAYIGPKDMKLAQKLIESGPEHRKFLRQIFVSVDITAPLYFFKQLDTYKVGTVANSTSTMHKLTSKPITIDCFEIDDWNPELIYFSNFEGENRVKDLSDFIIEQLEFLRKKYLETKDKKYWKELVRWLPSGWLQTRTWTTNYETIRAICSKGQRRFHKLNEWSGFDNPECENFIDWVRKLPYAQYLIFDDEDIAFPSPFKKN